VASRRGGEAGVLVDGRPIEGDDEVDLAALRVTEKELTEIIIDVVAERIMELTGRLY
jgi:hypothetical protein